MPHPEPPTASVFSAPCSSTTVASTHAPIGQANAWVGVALPQPSGGGEMRARGEVAASSRMLVHPAHFAIRCAQGTSGDLTHPYVRRPVHSSSCSGASAVLDRPDCDGEPYTQRLEVPQARRSTSQHIAASVREGRPKPSLTVPSETAHVGRAHAAAKQSRARCGRC